ncbi:MAG TPA: class I SAM-dependent methyltransferase [Tepidisphaeraceae bacterium]|jgi:ubiquinone/menaquinone biosynthesis C-methylase UbiE
MPSHQHQTIDQFTRQAACFAESPAIQDEAALQRMIRFAGINGNDDVLDVACGPGILTCACASVARHATGIDITPAMIDRARDLRRRQGLENVTWHVGDVRSLPFADESFSVVLSRYAFHHLTNPLEVLVEMTRVCRPAGRVVVIDVAAPADLSQALALNQMERLRDPSHVRARSAIELTKLFARAGLAEPEITSHRIEFPLEAVLDSSFPTNGETDKAAIRRMFEQSLTDDAMGLQPQMNDGQIRYSYPIAVLKSTREIQRKAQITGWTEGEPQQSQ